jgi:PAS domain S-box-containing protein
MSILIVDDSPEDAAVIRANLSSGGAAEGQAFRFRQCEKGEEGLAACHAELPDCIVLDHQLPDMDGVEFLGRLKDALGNTLVPVVVLTGSADKALSAAVLSAGAQEYLPKRFMEPEMLFRAVRTARDRFALLAARRADERALADKERRLRLTQEAAHIGTWDWELGSDALHWSDENFVLHGMAPSAGLPHHDIWQSVIHPDDRAQATAAMNAALADGAEYETEYRVVLPDGGIRWLAGRGFVTRNDSGRAIRLLGVNVDITARRESADALARLNDDLERRVRERTAELVAESGLRRDADAQLLQAGKMDAIGQLTGGIAHDFNNILGVIMGNLELAMGELERGRSAQPRLDAAMRGIDRGASLTHRLLAFARKQPLDIMPVDLAAMLPDMGNLLGRTLGEHVTIRLDCDEELWTVLADAAQVENALLNLALNARDAMRAGGRLGIRFSNRVFDEADARRHGAPAAGDYVMLAVSDTGTGMTPDVLARIFEPFFTTKGPASGSGLGLAMVYGFAKQSGGGVWVDSVPGEGTTVQIYLPRAGSPALAVPQRQAATAFPRGSATVLVVEDESAVRDVVVANLRDLGYRVLHAADGAEAIDVFTANADQVDLLLADVVLPGGMRGDEVARRLTAIRSRLPVLFMSGFTDDVFPADGHARARVNLINKPFRKEQLALKVADMLGTLPRPGLAA